MLTLPLGNPEGHWKAFKSRFPTDSAFSRKMASPLSAKADKRPPKTRMFVSKTETDASTSASKDCRDKEEKLIGASVGREGVVAGGCGNGGEVTSRAGIRW